LPVSENDVIAELERETPGKIGRTVYGKEIETLSGAPLERAGTNIFMSEKNIFANAEGSVFKDCGGLHVEPLLSLKGVTNREINHNGSVKILGDVESCPMIQASGDIEIHGTVNNTKMRAGRSLVIHGNLFTKPDKPIVAGQNFLGQNVSNAVVTAQNIVITATSFNSTLTAYDTIQNLGPEGKIVGGVCFAGAAVFASGLGSSTSIPTTISVSTVEGVKKHKKEMVSYYLRKAEELKNHFFLLEGKMERIEKLERALPIEARPAYKPMRKSIEELTEKCELRLDGIQQKAAEINGAGRKNRGEIHAKKIFPNVTLLMGNQKREIRDTQTDIHLYVKGAEIFSEPV
ncbi:MAG: FapA family protein, partial [Nitrospinota bacterium]